MDLSDDCLEIIIGEVVRVGLYYTVLTVCRRFTRIFQESRTVRELDPYDYDVYIRATIRLGGPRLLRLALREFTCDDCLTGYFGSEVLAVAAGLDRLDCMEVAREKEFRCPWSEKVCQRAAEAGSLACLTYARQGGCPWDEFTTAGAMVKARSDCLDYALDNGCPWSEDAFRRLRDDYGGITEERRWQYLYCLFLLQEAYGLVDDDFVIASDP